jgi:hypothetical protein
MTQDHEKYFSLLVKRDCKICEYLPECRARGYENCTQNPIKTFSPVNFGTFVNRQEKE